MARSRTRSPAGARARARNDDDKLARRSAILAVAAEVLGRRQYATVTMAEIAERCGLAKGTLYLYFPTKEALFLAALEGELVVWFAELGASLTRAGKVGVQQFARTVAGSLIARERLVDLLALLHTVLEQNIEVATALPFKRMLRDNVVMGGALVEAAIDGLRPGDGVRLLLRTHALVVGLRQMADPPPALRELVEREDLAELRVDFAAELEHALAELAAGMLLAARAAGRERRDPAAANDRA